MERIDIGRTLERAYFYFTLLELLGSERRADDIWRSASLDNGVHDLQALTREMTGRLDFDATTTAGVYLRVKESFGALQEADRVLELGRGDYPPLLAATPHASTFLFARDPHRLLRQPAIAVVGTRSPTDDGRRRAWKLGYLLAQRGIVVTSGLARGIDEAAHYGALEIGGPTVAVLGTPLTRTYPAEHQRLQQTIGRLGALASQYYPGAKIGRWAFPKRNAVMSGLTLGTVVVEASETSGALIQAQRALEQNRKLFIPRSAIENARLKWPKRLEAQGAHVFSSVEELVRVLEDDGLIPSSTEVRASAGVVRLNAS